MPNFPSPTAVISHLEVKGCCQQAQSRLLTGSALISYNTASDFHLFLLSGLLVCWGWSGSLQRSVYHDFPPNTPSLKYSDEFLLHKNVAAEKLLKCASSRCSGLLHVPLSASICVKLFTTLYVSALHHGLAFSISALVPGIPLLPSAQRWSVESKMWLTILGWVQKCQRTA